MRHLTDEYGSITARMSYDPYGAPLQPNTASSLGFTGELTDPTGLVYLRARTYNPALGIFTQRDPVLGVAGLSASYNGYGYVHGNPANLRDPSGECIGPLAIVCAVPIGAAAGAAAGVAIDAGVQVVDIAINQRALITFDWGRTVRAGVVGAVGGAFGGGIIGVGSVVAASIGMTAATSGATAAGVLTVGLSGVVGGRAATLTGNVLAGQDPLNDYWNIPNMARDAFLAIGGTWLLGSAANALTRSSTNYFTAFLPRSFVDLMPADEAIRYKAYWEQVASRQPIRAALLDDIPWYEQFWAPEEGETLASQIRGIRARYENLYPDLFNSLKGRTRGNFAIARSSIDDVEDFIVGVSGRRAMVDVAPPIQARSGQHFEAMRLGGQYRHNDAEYRIMEYLADRLTQQSRGNVWLYTERPPCHSCASVLYEQFPIQFPNITLRVYHGR